MYDTKRHPARRYLIALLALFGLSLVLSPPTGPAPVTGSSLDTPTREKLTIALSKYVGRADKLSVAVKDLRTGEEYRIGDQEKHDGASTTKLAIVLWMYHQAANNQFDLDETLTLKPGEVQRYGTGTIQYESPPYRYSWRELAKRMMKSSDNTSAYVLASRLDKQRLQQFVDAQGLSSTDVANANTTTAADMLKLMELIYRSQLTDTALTDELLTNMRDTDFEDRLPPNLPDDARVTHKTGDAFDGGLHDVGVIEYRGNVYAVSLFSYGLATEEIAEISRLIFDYFTRPQKT